MNEIFHRVSVRKYQDRPVEPEKLECILRAAMAAPSACNQQPWEFYVVRRKDKLMELATASPYTGFTADAPVAIVAAYRVDCFAPDYAQIDLSAAMENICLEADSLGLGGTWMGIAPIEERMKRVERMLDMPEGLRAFAIFSLGYPGESRPQEDRYDPARVHWIG